MNRVFPYTEKDMYGRMARKNFRAFYKANRSSIYRGPEGIEFPIFTDGVEIRQGIGATIAYLHAGSKLDGFFSARKTPPGMGGRNPHFRRKPTMGRRLSSGAALLKKSYISSCSWRPTERTVAFSSRSWNEGLAQLVMIMNVLGPRSLYQQDFGRRN
ncbi:MAG: hypothetical protein ACOX37_08765 [Bacillota bacterium]